MRLTYARMPQVEFAVALQGLPARACSLAQLRGACTPDAPSVPFESEMQSFLDSSTGRLEAGPFTLHRHAGTVPGYGSVTLKVEFEPVDAGEREVDALVEFTSLADSSAAVPPLALHLQVCFRPICQTCLRSPFRAIHACCAVSVSIELIADDEAR